MQGDVEELRVWLDWLAEKGRPITLVGHSAGSTHILAAMNGREVPQVTGVILISLLHFDEDPLSHNTFEAYQKALNLQEQGINTLETFSLAFCAEYPSEPAPFISYREWGKQRTIQALNELRTQATVIIGGSDGRITADWIKALESANARLVVVEGAGHFFDAHTEFDLLDSVTGQLDQYGF
jgi:pimeloyl-ACP methyl ester carboxylesterase